jgi:HSP20 family protein
MERNFDTLPSGVTPSIEPWGGGLVAFPNVDVYEDREEIVFRAELPGMEQKDVELVIEDSTLTMRGERKLFNQEKRENFESSYGTFARSFGLPGTIDREKIRAEMKGGLEVHIPKREGARGKSIPIRT